MAKINGVQLARLWAKALRGLLANPIDTTFKDLLESDPLAAAKQFKAECDAAPATHAPFPDPDKLNLLDIEAYEQPGLNFKTMPNDKRDGIVNGTRLVPWWTRSKFFILSADLETALKNGELEIRSLSDEDEHY